MNFGEIFGKSWKEYWENFGSFFKFMLIFLALPTLILAIISIVYITSNPEVWAILGNPQIAAQLSSFDLFNTLSGYFILSSIFTLVSILLTIYILKGIITVSLKKDKYTSSELTHAAKNNFWAFLGFEIVSLIFVILLLILFIIPGIIFAIFWIFGAFIFVSQNKGIIGSLKISFHMVKGRWWKTFGYFILVMLVGAGVSIVVSLLELPFSIMNILYATTNGYMSKSLFILSSLMNWLTDFIASLFIVPFFLIFFKNYYLSLLHKNKGKKNK
ncbi:MAG: hypothetical protein Q8Q31_00885 [Nanoarchaeota archaeon]|nr:hypothetical protein [Nanoarchaeota archaeon]